MDDRALFLEHDSPRFQTLGSVLVKWQASPPTGFQPQHDHRVQLTVPLFTAREISSSSRAILRSSPRLCRKFPHIEDTVSMPYFRRYSSIGDKGPNTADGPAFKYQDVNIGDLRLTGNNIPAAVEAGDKFRFVAEVGEFNADQCLFFLDPVQEPTLPARSRSRAKGQQLPDS
ncbi:DUF4839 domain-containing protein [Actinacidiphila glaucinigra]|uniref:DUF4839 domain-containing protein n=1 Tax=Actinacidiphila glaucinigra TaxID=235986 RepID=UPI0036B8C4E8